MKTGFQKLSTLAKTSKQGFLCSEGEFPFLKVNSNPTLRWMLQCTDDWKFSSRCFALKPTGSEQDEPGVGEHWSAWSTSSREDDEVVVVVDDSSCASSTDTGLEFSMLHSSSAAACLLLRPGSRCRRLRRSRPCFLPAMFASPPLLEEGEYSADRPSSSPASSGLKLRSRNSSFSRLRYVGLSLNDADVVLTTLGRGEQHGVGGGGDKPSAELADRLRRSVCCWSRGGVGMASSPMSLATMQGLLAGDAASSCFSRNAAAAAAASSPRRSPLSPPVPPRALSAQRRRRRKSSAKEECASFAMSDWHGRVKARSGTAWSEGENVGWCLSCRFELRAEGRRRKWEAARQWNGKLPEPRASGSGLMEALSSVT